MFRSKKEWSFADEAAHILSRSSPKFDFERITKLGLKSGNLNSSEADVLRTRFVFPDKIAEEICGIAGVNSNYDDRSYSISEICSRVDFEIGSASVAPGTRLPQHFTQTAVHAPAIKAIRGSKAQHHTLNFQKLSWTSEGIIKPLSDSGSHLYRPFLEGGQPLEMTGATFICVVEGSAIYTHWLLDTLPKLLIYIENFGQLSDFDNIIFATTNSNFHKYTLDKLGVPDEIVYTRQKHGTYIYTDDFVSITPVRSHCIAADGVYERVRDFFIGSEPNRSHKGRHIYISRAKARRRRIVNEEELWQCLQRYDFEFLTLESYNISQTARILSEASHVIAPHGAGLTNLIFSSSGTKVLEIFGAHMSLDYWRICEQLAFEYHAYQALDPDGHPISEKVIDRMGYFERNGYDMYVDTRDFEKFLQSVFLG